MGLSTQTRFTHPRPHTYTPVLFFLFFLSLFLLSFSTISFLLLLFVNLVLKIHSAWTLFFIPLLFIFLQCSYSCFSFSPPISASLLRPVQWPFFPT